MVQVNVSWANGVFRANGPIFEYSVVVYDGAVGSSIVYSTTVSGGDIVSTEYDHSGLASSINAITVGVAARNMAGTSEFAYADGSTILDFVDPVDNVTAVAAADESSSDLAAGATAGIVIVLVSVVSHPRVYIRDKCMILFCIYTVSILFWKILYSYGCRA